MRRVDGDYEIETALGKSLWVAWIAASGVLAFMYPIVVLPIAVAAYVIWWLWWWITRFTQK